MREKTKEAERERDRCWPDLVTNRPDTVKTKVSPSPKPYCRAALRDKAKQVEVNVCYFLVETG